MAFNHLNYWWFVKVPWSVVYICFVKNQRHEVFSPQFWSVCIKLTFLVDFVPTKSWKLNLIHTFDLLENTAVLEGRDQRKLSLQCNEEWELEKDLIYRYTSVKKSIHNIHVNNDRALYIHVYKTFQTLYTVY